MKYLVRPVEYLVWLAHNFMCPPKYFVIPAKYLMAPTQYFVRPPQYFLPPTRYWEPRTLNLNDASRALVPTQHNLPLPGHLDAFRLQIMDTAT